MIEDMGYGATENKESAVNVKSGESTVHLSIFGLSCGSCVQSLEGALKMVEGITDVSVNLMTGIEPYTWCLHRMIFVILWMR